MIYLDYNATTPVAAEVAEAMLPFLTERFGNPSSAHALGEQSRVAIDDARASLAKMLGTATTDEIVFTSGGTESDNWAILGSLAMTPDNKHIVTTAVEHEAVRKLCDKLEPDGYEVTRLPVDENGEIDLDDLRAALRPDTAIVSIMTANNETGVLFPVTEAAAIVREHSDAIFHTDAVNAAGKIPINLVATEIDLLSVSGHKFYGPKGIGALYIRNGLELPPYFTGGGQESGRRPGTEAVHQIVGLGAAAKSVVASEQGSVLNLRNTLEDGILTTIPNAVVNGSSDRSKRLPNTTNVSFENTNGEMIVHRLDALGICVSTGSACNAIGHVSSETLRAMNVPFSRAMGAIRFSLGRYNTSGEIDEVLRQLPDVVASVQAMTA